MTTEAIEEVEGPHVAVRRFRLEVTAGSQAGVSYTSTRERVVIGTDQAADLLLADATVSRFHCELVVVDGHVDVRDLGSRNGTLVDGLLVHAARLRPGSTLTLGRTQIRFEPDEGHVRVPLSSAERFGLLVGRSSAMRSVFRILERTARGNATVLLGGETGTGKDAAAESIHRASDRSHGPFVIADCAALPASLLESELFGHERGAFTGAERPRAGAFENASGGTLFLDEIGELSLELQPKLLRAIERRDIQRVGGNARIPLDVRVIAATSQNLRAEVNARRFRSDLYYRLAVIEVQLPLLRDRQEDIPLLIEDLLRQMGETSHPAATRLRDPALHAELATRCWPGNVRELRNYVERCLLLEDPPAPADEGAAAPAIGATLPLRVARERWNRVFERAYLQDLLDRHDGNITAAAQAAGVDRAHLHRLLTRVGVRRDGG